MAYLGKKKRHNKQAIAVADIVGGVLDTRPLKMRLLHEDVFRQWQKIVGKGLVDKCQPRRIKGHTLHLDVVSSSWAHQLIYLQEEIISRVNKLAGTLLIASIHCRAVKKRELKIVDLADKSAISVLNDKLVSPAETKKWQSEIAAKVNDPDLCALLSRMRCHSEIKRRALQDP
jgi:hypothetical protein